LGFGASSLGLRVWGLGRGASSLGFGVWGLGVGVREFRFGDGGWGLGVQRRAATSVPSPLSRRISTNLLLITL